MKLLFLTAMTVLVGCTNTKTTFVSDDVPTMKEVYETKFRQRENLGRSDVARALSDEEGDWNRDVKRQIRELRDTFQYLPNPLLTMYIYPHLTDAGTPVPGYITFFKFYEKDHVGLPEEFNRPVSMTPALHDVVTP